MHVCCFFFVHITIAARMEWMDKQRMKKKNKMEFNVEVQVLGLYVYIQFICLSVSSGCLAGSYESSICIFVLMLMNLTCSHRSDSMMSSMILPSYFSFLLTLTRKWMAHEYTMNVGEEKKKEIHTFLSRFQIL